MLRFAGKVDHHQGKRRKTQQLDSVRGFVHGKTPIWFEQEHPEDQDRCDRSQQTRQTAASRKKSDRASANALQGMLIDNRSRFERFRIEVAICGFA